jgi:phage shock protein A
MNIMQRFRLLLKGQINAAFDAIEDPERSLHQLVHDMEEELDAAKHAVARAMANEDRLRAQIEFHTKDAVEWQRAAERAAGKGNEPDAREALRRVELAERQRDKLAQQLERQSQETEEVRQSVIRMQERCDQAKSRLQVVQAQMRQVEARKAIGGVLSSAHAHNLHGEFERISGRVEEEAATERNYQRLDDQLSGEDVRRRFEADAVADAVEERLARLRTPPEETGEAAGGPAR